MENMEKSSIDQELNILFVDDEPGILEQGKTFLEKEDERYSVETAISVGEALDLIENQEFDAVVSDYKMPETDGIDFLEQIREEKGRDLPFIIVTGKGKEEVAMEAINLGADGYLQKGGDPKTQYSKLAHIVSREIDYRETEKALHKSEEKYRLIFEKNPIGLLECNPECEVIDINERMIEIIGAPNKKEAVGSNLRGTDENEFIKDLEEAVKEKKVVDGESNFTSPWEKEIRMSYRILPLKDEDGEVFEITVACHDVIFY